MNNSKIAILLLIVKKIMSNIMKVFNTYLEHSEFVTHILMAILYEYAYAPPRKLNAITNI